MRVIPWWLWLLACVALAVLAFHDLLLYDPQATTEVEEWFFVPSDTAPPLVLLFSAWLAYRRRHWLRFGEARLAPAIAVLLTGFAVHLWALRFEAPDLQALALIACLLGGGLAVAGRSALRAFWVPALFMVFAMPLPAPVLTELVWRFQLWTADYSGWMLNLLGIPSFISGDLIIQASETFQVIETCSGLRGVETLTMLTVVMIDLFRRRGWHAAILMLAAPAVAFALNGFRVLTLILNPHSKIAAVHNLQGVLVLMGGLIFLYMLDGALGRAFGSAPYPRKRKVLEATPGPRETSRLAAVALCLCVFVLASFVVPPYHLSLPSLDPIQRHLAVSADGWKRVAELRSDRVFLQRVGFRQSVYRRYERGEVGTTVDVFVGVGDHSKRTRTPFSPKTALPGSGWRVEERGVRRIGADQRQVGFEILRKETRWRVVYHWYEGAGRWWQEGLRALLALDQTPFHRDRAGLVIRLETELTALTAESQAQAERKLTRFYPTLREALDSYQRSIERSTRQTAGFPLLGKDFPHPAKPS